jgi:hypothetical protein
MRFPRPGPRPVPTHPVAQAPPTILHKVSYVSPAQLARRIQSMRRVCNTASFLDCCIEYNEIKGLCAAFAAVLGDTTFEDPDAFQQAFASRDDEEAGY